MGTVPSPQKLSNSRVCDGRGGGGGGSRGDGKITRDLGGREDRWPDQNLQEEDIYKK